MEKIKLTVCMEDEEYRTRFVKCVMKHYKELFEIHVVIHTQELIADKKTHFGVIITGDDERIEPKDIKEFVWLVLMDRKYKKDNSQNNIFYTEKYQEVYKIIEDVEKAVSEKFHSKSTQNVTTEALRIGIFSLGKESMQIAFAALAAEILGENHKVLLMDIQPFSGLAMEIEAKDVLGMEDLMSVAATLSYTENRIAASIGHEQRWDYIYPVKNVSCLAEASGELYEKMLELIQGKKHYDYIIVNFGAVCPGIIEFMEKCHKIYILTEKKEERNWREINFIEEMNLHEKEYLLQNMKWVEIPVGLIRERSWRQQFKNWLWNELGDFVRKEFWMEGKDG